MTDAKTEDFTEKEFDDFVRWAFNFNTEHKGVYLSESGPVEMGFNDYLLMKMEQTHRKAE